MMVIDVVKKYVEELSPDWHGDLNHAYIRKNGRNLC